METKNNVAEQKDQDKRKGIFAIPIAAIETPKNGDTVYVSRWWCTDDRGNVYFTTWGMPLAYEKESSCRLVGSRFGLSNATLLILAYVTPGKHMSKDWLEQEFSC